MPKAKFQIERRCEVCRMPFLAKPINQLQYMFPRLKKIIADGGYSGKLADFVKDLGWELSVVLRPDESSKKFQVLPLRWIVERTFSWIENYRRMTTDYEYKTESAEAMLQITFCQIMLKKIIRINSKQFLSITW